MTEQVNFIHVVPDSQYYTDLDMIIRSVEFLKARIKHPNAEPYTVGDITYHNITSLEDEINHFLVGLINTKEKGYRLNQVEDKPNEYLGDSVHKMD